MPLKSERNEPISGFKKELTNFNEDDINEKDSGFSEKVFDTLNRSVIPPTSLKNPIFSCNNAEFNVEKHMLSTRSTAGMFRNMQFLNGKRIFKGYPETPNRRPLLTTRSEAKNPSRLKVIGDSKSRSIVNKHESNLYIPSGGPNRRPFPDFDEYSALITAKTEFNNSK